MPSDLSGSAAAPVRMGLCDKESPVRHDDKGSYLGQMGRNRPVWRRSGISVTPGLTACQDRGIVQPVSTIRQAGGPNG
jgi:hypothetical protein